MTLLGIRLAERGHDVLQPFRTLARDLFRLERERTRERLTALRGEQLA